MPGRDAGGANLISRDHLPTVDIDIPSGRSTGHARRLVATLCREVFEAHVRAECRQVVTAQGEGRFGLFQRCLCIGQCLRVGQGVKSSDGSFDGSRQLGVRLVAEQFLSRLDFVVEGLLSIDDGLGSRQVSLGEVLLLVIRHDCVDGLLVTCAEGIAAQSLLNALQQSVELHLQCVGRHVVNLDECPVARDGVLRHHEARLVIEGFVVLVALNTAVEVGKPVVAWFGDNQILTAVVQVQVAVFAGRISLSGTSFQHVIVVQARRLHRPADGAQLLDSEVVRAGGDAHVDIVLIGFLTLGSLDNRLAEVPSAVVIMMGLEGGLLLLVQVVGLQIERAVPIGLSHETGRFQATHQDVGFSLSRRLGVRQVNGRDCRCCQQSCCQQHLLEVVLSHKNDF